MIAMILWILLKYPFFFEIDACGHDAPMNETCKDDFSTVIYDNPCYFDKSYHNPLFVPSMDILDNEEFCLESLYDNALDDGPMLLDDINYNYINGTGDIDFS